MQKTDDVIQEILTDSDDFSYATSKSSPPPQFSQPELNDQERDFGLSKNATEILASRLQEKALLNKTTKISYIRNREQVFVEFFKEENKFVYCHNISGLLQELGIPLHNPKFWRLFLDSSHPSLKSVLLHNSNIYAVVPVSHPVRLQEEHDDIKTVIDLLKYHKHNWTICVDLKMVNFLLG